MRNVKVEGSGWKRPGGTGGKPIIPNPKLKLLDQVREDSGVRSQTRALNIPGSGLILLQVFDSLHQRFCLENLTRTGLDSAPPMRNV